MTRQLAIAGVVLIALAAAFSAGRFSAPLKVEERERVVYRDKLVEVIKTVEVKAKAETKVVYKDRVVTRDGTVTERIVERTDTKTDETKGTDSSKTSDRSQERETVKTVTLRPNWRVGILAGASLTKPLVPIAGPLVLGLQVEHRIAGPVSAGLWINTVGAAGAVLSIES